LQNELKNKRQNNELNLREDLKNILNEIMSVNFSSIDEKINYSIPCIGSNIFIEIEEKLYKKYPEYCDSNNVFLYKGNNILKYKTLSENKIENGSQILLMLLK